uniref:Dodeca-satellite-binding protein 1 (inferred by orthology to a D. melanogaster protein) n=1 Tax=Strongyloides venezuelensis TaxID=75913 RepID=A0A0K0FBP1_STRVS
MNGQSEFTFDSPSQPTAGFSLENNENTGKKNNVSMNGEKKDKVVMDYSTDFPSLPTAPTKSAGGNQSAWGKQPVLKSTLVTEFIKLSSNERAARGFSKNDGSVPTETKKCKEIASETGCKIDLSEAKDGSLSIMITGKQKNVTEAQGRLIRELQTQGVREIKIPKEHYGFVIGKEGSILKKLENEFYCRIFMPNKEDNKDFIKITGPGNFADACADKILSISSERSKQTSENLEVEKQYYPWIRGAYNVNIERWTENGNVKVNIPPPNVDSNKINITGEKEAVIKVVNEIRKIYHEKKEKIKTVTTKIPRSQRRFVLGNKGSGIQDILKNTDCIIEVPAEDDDSENITIHGTEDKIILALSAVYTRATSIISTEIKAPQWLHKYLIGPKGGNLQNLFPTREKLKIEFNDNSTIFLEGPPQEVSNGKQVLSDEIDKLLSAMDSQVVKVPIAYHRHLVGKAGTNITKLRDEFDVNVVMPNENTNSEDIVVEGKKGGVKKCIDQIKEVVKKMENEKSRDIIIEQRFHKNIIGNKGESINKLRQQYPSVSIGVPDASSKSDIINIRGNKGEVDKVHAYLTKLQKELIESNYQESVPIFKEFHKHIIGKGGSTINKIRDETSTRIDIPLDGSSDDKIVVTGKKENVKKAVDLLTKIQNEQSNIISVNVPIPSKAATRFAYTGRRLLADIEKECENVFFSLPKDKNEKIVIRGPKEYVGNAEKLVDELLNTLNEQTEESSVKAQSSFHKFLIGKAGSKVKKIRETYSTVRILFPDEKDEKSDIIQIVGKKDEVQAVKKLLEQQIEELKQTVEDTIDVDRVYHKHFVSRGSEVLKEIQTSNGNVQIYFPKISEQSNTVTLKGSKDCVESAKARIEEIVEDLKAQVTIEFEIDNKHFRSILSNRGAAIHDISKQYNVRIKFPERNAVDEIKEDGKNLANIITITGNNAKVNDAKNDLLALVPITKEVVVSREHHRSLIGRGGEGIRNLQQTYNVNVSIPQESEQSDIITVSGVANKVEACIMDIEERIGEFEKIAADRQLRSYKVSISVPAKYHQKLIGRRGAAVNEMRNKFDVQISFPKDGDAPDMVTITGYEKNVNECKEEIEKIVSELDSMFSQEVELDPRFHPRMIGTGGRALRKLCDDFKVDIRMPSKTDENPSLVVVSGKNEDDVFNCIEELKIQEEDYVELLIERGQYYTPTTTQSSQEASKSSRTVQITGAPWQMDNEEQFPSMSSNAQPANSTGAPVLSGVWGARLSRTSC